MDIFCSLSLIRRTVFISFLERDSGTIVEQEGPIGAEGHCKM